MANEEQTKTFLIKRAQKSYKAETEKLWQQIGEGNFNRFYGYKGSWTRDESWEAVVPLWGNRYGGGTTYTAGDEEGEIEVSGKGESARGAYGSKIITDGLNALEKMSYDEIVTLAGKQTSDRGVAVGIEMHAREMAKQQIDKLKAHLKATRDGDSPEPPYMDPARNSITNDLMDKEDAATKKAKPKPNTPDGDTTESIPLSRAGIAYETIEYREQCFLLSQIFKIVTHKHDVLEAEDMGSDHQALYPAAEYKPLPYIDEGQAVLEKKDDTGPGTKKPIGNACIMVDDPHGPYGFVNKLTQYRTQQDFLNLKTSDLSQLQPQIRLYKVHNTFGEDGSPLEQQQEVMFETSTTPGDLESLLKNKAKRGFGAGIKNFTVNYEASNPFAIKKSISAELTIFANTFDELLVDRGGYSYIDLALRTGGLKDLEKMRMEHGSQLNRKERVKRFNLNKLNFRLKAVVGWMLPPASSINSLSSRDARQMLYNSYVTINLTPTIHSFDFDEAGRVNFKIQYLAYIEDFFDEKDYSVFGDPSQIFNQADRDHKYRMIEENCDNESLKEFKEKLQKEVAQDLADARTVLWRQLATSGKIRMINLKYTTLRKFQKLGPYFDLPKAEMEAWNIQNVSEDIKFQQNLLQELKKYKKTEGKAVGHADAKNANTDRQVNLAFFYVSDLMDVILGGIEKNLDAMVEYYSRLATADKQDMEDRLSALTDEFYNNAIRGKHDPNLMKKFDALVEEFETASASQLKLDLNRASLQLENFRRYRLLLGPLEIYNPEKPGESVSINMGDLPVSFKYFMEWLTSKTLQKDRPFYPLPTFLNDFFNGLINGFLNDASCFSRGTAQAHQPTTLNQVALTAYRDDPTKSDTISEMLHNYRKTMQELKGKDFNRLDLYYHDATAAKSDDTVAPIRSWPILNISGPQNSHITSRDINHEINYACYFAGRTHPQESQNGDIGQDNDMGIMHYTTGKDRGLVKNIKFQKTETPGLAEVRYEQQGYDGLSQLRVQYNVAIDTYANVSAFPGSYIFVDPRGLAPNMAYSGNSSNMIPSPEDLTTYGLGGYYMIIRSTHSFGEGRAETRIDAQWVAEMGGSQKEGDKEAQKVDAEDRLTKCSYDKEGRFTHSGTASEPTDTVGRE
jgi:hypothetical protein